MMNAFMKLTIPWIIVSIVFTMLEISFLSIVGLITFVTLLAWSYWFIKLQRKIKN